MHLWLRKEFLKIANGLVNISLYQVNQGWHKVARVPWMACLKTLWNITTTTHLQPKDFQGNLLNNTCHLKWIVGKFACKMILTIDILVLNTTMYIYANMITFFHLKKFHIQLAYPLWSILVPWVCNWTWNLVGGLATHLAFYVWSILVLWVFMWTWNLN